MNLTLRPSHSQSGGDPLAGARFVVARHAQAVCWFSGR